jgi:uncharacterized integral membrane protein
MGDWKTLKGSLRENEGLSLSSTENEKSKEVQMARNIVFVVLIALVIVFVIQNMQVVEVRLLVWTVSMSRALMILVTLLIGIVAGWLLRRPRH